MIDQVPAMFLLLLHLVCMYVSDDEVVSSELIESDKVVLNIS